jgi:hypothetical protein
MIDGPKDQMIFARVSPAAKYALQKSAKSKGQTVSELIRSLVYKEIGISK